MITINSSNKKILLIALILNLHFVMAQTARENILYIIDSIPVIKDPEKGDEINNNDIETMTVIKNKDSLKTMGYEKFDGVMYIFTKEYHNRAKELKQIPSLRQMVKKDGLWYIRDSVYSGKFFDYYYSGRKRMEGTIVKGKADGNLLSYYQNGKVAREVYYNNGLLNSTYKEYYENGSLKQNGKYINDKEQGIWQSYFPNGQVKLYSVYHDGELVDSAIKYYSTGILKEKVFIKNGKAIQDDQLVKREKLMAKSKESEEKGDLKGAIKYCTKIIESDSINAMAYFSRGTIELNNFQFDESVTDFDKALKLEPFMEVAYGNRAFARIRKYEFKDNRTLLKNSEVTVLASKGKAPVPAEELVKICDDLAKAISLGNNPEMITDAVAKYCPTSITR